jgi:hypothetical protein
MKDQSKEPFTPPSHWVEDESEDDESASINDPEIAQPECLAPSRLDQPGATAQVDGNKDAHPVPDAEPDITQGKSASCTADESLRTELATLCSSVPDTLRALITFERQSVQMFFSPENPIASFRNKVEETWNIPSEIYHLLINGVHESRTPKAWPHCTNVQIKIRGPEGTKPQAQRIKVYLKVSKDPKVYVFEMKEESTLEEVSDLVEDVFGREAGAKLYQGNALLDVNDSLQDWLSATGSKSEITLGADIDFVGDETIEHLPVMETTFEGKVRWVQGKVG